MMEPDPNTAAELGHMVENYDDDLWNQERVRIMTQGLTYKFSQNPRLKQILLATGDDILAAVSTISLVWAIGIDKKQAVANGDKWPGANLLGKCLETVRTALRSEQAQSII